MHSASLLPLAFAPLPLGSVRPAGWLLRQLRIQADGLSGHLDEFWPDIARSAWIGGTAEGWERGPYWLDGLVPLAYLLGDAGLTARVNHWADYILTHQQEDGWLGPIQDTARHERLQAYDPWPVYVALKALTQYEAATGDRRVEPAVRRFFVKLDRLLDEKPLFDWGKFRWGDLLLSIYWLYDRRPERWLLDLAAKARSQGYDWHAHFAGFRYLDKAPRAQTDLSTHVVNNAMAIKTPAVWYRQSGAPADRAATFHILEMLDAYHGQATGVFSGDEHYAGKSPSQGTELCAVVEMMFSLETAIGVLGNGGVPLADRLERIAFNALPATLSPDMWLHQYDQQANQVLCAVSPEPVFETNGPESNLFGLEPNYACCTANMHQGWPKFAAHLWMRSADAGLAAVAYSPCSVDTTIAGQRVRVDVETEYPFDETVHVRVQTEAPVAFPLWLRVPAWCEAARLRVGRAAEEPATPGVFHSIERTWDGSTDVELRLPMRAGVQRRYHGGIAIERGPLVYSLRIGEDWRLLRGSERQGAWEVYPTTPWNYALEMDPARPEAALRFERRPLGDCPFSPAGAPVVATAHGRRLPAWKIERNAAGPLPWSPVEPAGPLEELTLIPYGCTNLRVTEFPYALPR